MTQEKPKHPVTVIQNVLLEDFEQAVYRHKYEEAGKLLLIALRRLKGGADFIGYKPLPEVRHLLYTRFCAAVVALFADPNFVLSQEGFDHIASEHAVLDLMFRASAFGTSDHLLSQVADNPQEIEKNKLKLNNGPALAKFMLTYSLSSALSMNFEQTFKKSPQTLFSLWAGMLSTLLAVSQGAHDRREELVGLHHLFRGVKLTDAILPTLSDAYMYTSYCTRPDKHDAKATMNRLFAKMLKERNIPIPNSDQLAIRRIASRDREKPVIVVCIEWFSSLHAMYRCYAPIIRQLRTKFKLVAFSRQSDIDEIGKAEFDEWHEIPMEGMVIDDLVQRINMVAPDIMYYPSLGMAMWWTILSSVRLAPVQVMTVGHPASSRSETMDYVLTEEGSVGDESVFTEEIIYYPAGSAKFLMRSDTEIPEPLNEDHPDVVRIAVPAMLCKLNAPFMAALRRIRDACGRPVEFHFFVNMLGVNLQQSAAEIKAWVPEAKIYERTSYERYLQHLNGCHMHLCTFPFGGTNSNIDSMLIGLPMVTMEGRQPHERFDAMMIRRVGLPDSSICHSIDSYVAEAVRLIADDEERNRRRDHLRGFDLKNEFFGEPSEEQKTAFVDAMWTAYCRGGTVKYGREAA